MSPLAHSARRLWRRSMSSFVLDALCGFWRTIRCNTVAAFKARASIVDAEIHCFIKGGVYLVHQCITFIHSPNKATFTDWLAPWQWWMFWSQYWGGHWAGVNWGVSSSFSWEADRQSWIREQWFVIARDVDIVEESVVKLGAVDAVKLGMFRFRLGLLFGLLQHLFFFFRETVGAGSFGFQKQFLQRTLPLHLQHCTISLHYQTLCMQIITNLCYINPPW